MKISEEGLDVGSVVATISIDAGKADDTLNKIVTALQKFGAALESATSVVDKLNTKTAEIAPATATANAAMANTAQIS